jgi:uncharacterized membrane protein
MKASDFFTGKQKHEIVEAIKMAEHETSGEIRVHIELKCKGEVLDRAATIFANLNMHKTKLRNGVLFFLAVEDKKFAIIGDIGINKVVPDSFWDNVKELLKENFKQGKFAEGLVAGIHKAGEKLKSNFPYQAGDVNELPDEISFGKK